MQRWILGLFTVLVSATLAAAQQQPQTPVTSQPGDSPQIVAFDNDGLRGDYLHIFSNVPDLGKWVHSIASMGILAGRWEFFDGENFQGGSAASRDTRPGVCQGEEYGSATPGSIVVNDDELSLVRALAPVCPRDVSVVATARPWPGRPRRAPDAA